MYKFTEKDSGLLRALIATPAVSGNEFPLDRKLKGTFASEKFANWTIKRDLIGNLIAKTTPIARGKPTLLFSGHKDRIGFIVDEVYEDGTVKLGPIGGIGPIKSGMKLLLYNLQKNEAEEEYIFYLGGTLEIEQVVSGSHMRQLIYYVNFGYENRDKVKEYVTIGDPVAFDSEFKIEHGLITTPYLDDTIGVFTCLKLAEHFSQNWDSNLNIALSFTTQEEVGLRGIASVVRAIKPNLIIMIDVTQPSQTLLMGNGPAIIMSDPGIVLSIELREKLKAFATKHGISLQFEVYLSEGTSDWEYSVIEGYRTIPVGQPIENIHSTTEMTLVSDLEQLINFVILLKDNFTELTL